MKFLSWERGRHCFILASDKKQPSCGDDPKHRNNLGSKSTNHKAWPLNFAQVNMFPMRSALNKKIFGVSLPLLVQIVQNFFYCWLWFQPTQMLTKHFPAWFTQTSWFLCILCYCISFRKMVCYVFLNWLWVRNYVQFHCFDLDLWLANFKILSLFLCGWARFL